MSIKDFEAQVNAAAGMKAGGDGTKQVCDCGTEALLTEEALRPMMEKLKDGSHCPISMMFMTTIMLAEARSIITTTSGDIVGMIAVTEVMKDAQKFHKSPMGSYLTTKLALDTGMINAEKADLVWGAFKEAFPDFIFPTPCDHKH